MTFVPDSNSKIGQGQKFLDVLRNIKDSTNIIQISLVCTIPQYASIIWSPYYKIDILGIERVHRKVLRDIVFK